MGSEMSQSQTLIKWIQEWY